MYEINKKEIRNERNKSFGKFQMGGNGSGYA